MIIGHEKILQFFDEAMASEKLAHAYCLAGPEGVGKKKLALSLAARLLESPEEKLTAHPDYYFLARETDDKTGKLKKDISIAQARGLRERLQNHSWVASRQVAIIDEAELLNEESANALLKILEEPGEKSVLFLITRSDEMLLPTIRSRCQIFQMSLVSPEQIKAGLKEMGFSEQEADSATALSWGRPGRAIEFLSDGEIRAEYLDEMGRWQKLLDRPFYEKLKIIENLFGDKTDHIRERGKIQKILDLWMMLWRDLLLQKTGGRANFGLDEGLAEKVSAGEVVKIIDNLAQARHLLGGNIHPRLLLENSLL